MPKLTVLLTEKRWNEARGLCQGLPAVIAGPCMAVLDKREASPGQWEQKLSRRLSETHAGLRRFLWILGTIGSSAPFIGLFGTVVGIIKSFSAIAASGKSGFAVVAAGISEALIATAAGIIVAVIAVLLYNYFQVKLQGIALEFRNRLEDLADLVA
jgi:biopolymer transport protein ExbB/TolQ